MDFRSDVTQRLLELEKEIDRLKRSSTWESFTPTVTQSAAITLVVSYCKYMLEGNKVSLAGVVACTSAGVANNLLIIGGLPAIIQIAGAVGINNRCVGQGVVIDATAGLYVGALMAVSASQLGIVIDGAGLGAGVGIFPNIAVASGDVITFEAVYERG